MSRNSIVHLAKGIKFDRGYKNICNYTDTGFLDLVSNTQKVQSFTNLSYIRHDKPLDLEINYDKALQCNYLCFQNPSYSTKWFYAWIDKVEYISDRNVRIHFTIDVWATWSNKITKKACWVEREHVTDDTIGKHTIEEGLACNDFRVMNTTTNPNYLQDEYIVVLCNYDLEQDKNMLGATIRNGSVYGSEAYIFRFDKHPVDPIEEDGVLNFEKFLIALNQKNKLNEIQNIFILPYPLIGIQTGSDSKITKHTVPYLGDLIRYYKFKSFSYLAETFEDNLKHLFDDFSYTPHNNKCKVYPYHYLYVTNNSGNSNIYKIEQFSDIYNVKFNNHLCFSPGASGKIVPLNYKSTSNNQDEAIPLGKYPMCGWANDGYTNWLTQNALNEGTKFTKTALDLYTGKTLNAVNDVSSLIGDFRQASLLPSTSAGTNLGDVNFSIFSLRFDYFNMILKDEELKIIDDYFTKFGYKVNVNKIPEFNSRTYWNYVKIANNEAIGYGEIPADAMETINNIFRNGVTIWHHHSQLGDFSLHNWL